ncbi:hypothetical protein IFO69_13285 [Echinicola sp. CAU 1574]|uniref:Uncharacterized protein n=1 Tax=Echinicola arenosa TaxID=2774144 RepID=A0ABR9AQ48_9BACT|nr:hypothetical protein [Echinicola arenosa]MBD8489724.1 hypothetical protein [Echinicola arenosa]
MEENYRQLAPIWGSQWQAVRKWFYPAWLIYETSYRFYDYSISVYKYIEGYQESVFPILGETGTPILAAFCGMVTFAICTFFLTVPSSFMLYTFFKEDNLTETRFEEKLKRLL